MPYDMPQWWLHVVLYWVGDMLYDIPYDILGGGMLYDMLYGRRGALHAMLHEGCLYLLYDMLYGGFIMLYDMLSGRSGDAI